MIFVQGFKYINKNHKRLCTFSFDIHVVQLRSLEDKTSEARMTYKIKSTSLYKAT